MVKGTIFFEQREAQLLELCRRYPVDRLYLFGSILTDAFDPQKSDVDVQVFFNRSGNPAKVGAAMWEFWDELENIFGRKVDMITDQPVKNPVFKTILERTRQLVYERKGAEVAA